MRNRMTKYFVLTVFGSILFSVVCQADSRQPPAYIRPTLDAMVDVLFANGYVDPNDPDQLVGYVQIKDCNLLKRYYKDDFAWNKIKNKITSDAATLQRNVPTHFILDDEVEIGRYNFQTKSFDISSMKQLKNISQLTLLASEFYLCDNVQTRYSGTSLPTKYEFRPDAPLSIYRIPMSEGMARRILPDIKKFDDKTVQKRILYVSYYLSVDGVVDINNASVALGGHVDRIEFFMDPERTQRVKTLYNSL